MAGIKPNNFNSITPTGTTELYTQTGGINGKFTVEDLKNYLNEWTEVTVDITSSELQTIGTLPIELLPALTIPFKYYVIDKIYVEFYFDSQAFDFAATDILTIFCDSFNSNIEITPLISGIPTRRYISVLDNTTYKLVTDSFGVEFPVSTFKRILPIGLKLSTLSNNDATTGDGTMKVKIKYKIADFGL
jgi:hypothetical protein